MINTLVRFSAPILLLTFLPSFLLACAVSEERTTIEGKGVQWRSAGPGGGGWIQAIAWDTSDPNLLYVGSDVGGFYFSSDSGRTFETRNSGLRDYYIQSIAVHPRDSNIVIVGTLSGIHRSTDRGKTWTLVRAGFPPAQQYSFSSPISVVAFDPNRPDVIYAGIGRPREGKNGQGAIYRSEDAGLTWRAIATGQLPADAIVSDIKVRPYDSFTILAATSKGIFRSDNEGKSWENSNEGLPHLHTQRLAFSRSSPSVVYTSMKTLARDGRAWDGGVYRSDDAGRTWRTVNGEGMDIQVGSSVESPSMTSDIMEIAVDPGNGNVVYAGNRDWVTAGIRKTTDGGRTWSLLPAGSVNRTEGMYGWIMQWGPSVQCLSVSPLDPRRIAFGTSGHVFVSKNGGESWHQRYTRLHPTGSFSGNGLEVTCLNSVVPDPVRSERIYFCYLDIGLLVSDDRGKTFSRMSEGMKHNGNCFSVAVDPLSPSTLWAGTGEWTSSAGDICRSDDGGKTWRVVGKPESGLPAGQNNHLVLDPKSPVVNRRLLITSQGNGIFESNDGGTEWRCINGNLPKKALKQPRALVLDPNDRNHLLTALAGTPENGSGVYETRDESMRWVRVNRREDFAQITCMVTDPSDSRIIYVGTRESWDPKEKRLFRGGVFKSADGGISWRQILDYHFVSAIAVSPSDSRIIYVGTSDHPYHDDWAAQGVMKSRDGGRTWTGENTGLTHMNITSISISPHDPSLLYLGTGGNGAFLGRDREIKRNSLERSR